MPNFKHNFPSQTRVKNLDLLRGFTVILMIIFHFSYDLNYFDFAKFDVIHHPFWYFFPRLIVFLFLFSSGMALALAHPQKIVWKSFAKRIGLISFWAIVISVVTYYLYPDKWIYFGTLHAIAVISLFSLPFLNWPKLAASFGLALFIPSIFFDLTIPWIKLEHSSLDYISPFPWMGASLLGIFAVHKKLQLANCLSFSENFFSRSLNFLGHHSLIIYLIHQPILFALFSLVKVIRS